MTDRQFMSGIKPYIAHISDTPKDGWNDPLRGRMAWHTLISGEVTPTDSLTAGVAIFEPGDCLKVHRHEAAEVYYIMEGEGIMSLAGEERRVVPGTIIFIPGNALHGIRNEGQATLKMFYAFALNSFEEVVYTFCRSDELTKAGY